MNKGSFTKFRLNKNEDFKKFPKPQASGNEAKRWIRKELNIKRLPKDLEII